MTKEERELNHQHKVEDLIVQYARKLADGKTIEISSIDRNSIGSQVAYEAIGILVSDGLAYRSHYRQSPSFAEFRATFRLTRLSRLGLLDSVLAGKNNFIGAWHPKIEISSRDLYSKGLYDTAISEATKRLEIEMRKHAGLSKSFFGDALAVAAFKPGGPLYLPFNEEREDRGFQYLAQGVVSVFRNPTHHHDANYDDPVETGQILSFISFLLKIVEERSTLK